jgi:hypothetical protein
MSALQFWLPLIVLIGLCVVCGVASLYFYLKGKLDKSYHTIAEGNEVKGEVRLKIHGVEIDEE